MKMNEFDVDDTIRPQDDFDNYVNKKWKDANPIPDDQVRWGAFNILIDNTLKQLKELLEEPTSDPEFNKVTDFYKSGLNEEQINQAGIIPIKAILDKIESFSDKTKFFELIATLDRMGINPLFRMIAEPDADNPKEVIPFLITSGLGLPDRDYYFKEEREEIRKQYKHFITSLLKLYGLSKDASATHAEDVFSIEVQLAEVTPSNVERYDPDHYFHKTLFSTLQEWTPALNWREFFDLTIQKNVPYLSTDKKEFYRRIEDLLNTLSINQWKMYLKYKVLAKLAPYLNKEYEQAHFNFYFQTLRGQKSMQPRWKRVVSFINGYDHKIGTLLGKFYAKKYFPPESKAKMVELVGNLQRALKQRILDLDWMQDETKEKAMLKHQVFRAKIGYPDKWPEFESLKTTAENIYVENVLASNRYDFYLSMEKMFKPTDLDEWEMHPQSINAYFNPMKNEVVFPAGILQFPFFDVKADDPINYGAIGVVIGHEMTHSYDNHGAKFNHLGQLKNWWTESDLTVFNSKCQYYIDKFNTFTVIGNVGKEINVNGELTLGENIGDLGGLLTSYDAMQFYLKDHPNADADKKFLLSYGRIWRGSVRPEMVDQQVQTDPHPPAHWRVNGTLSHFPPFLKTFSVKPGDKLYSDDYEKIW
ncbi:MAG: M13 family metallopeptidase [Promethearchaeota archaeon]